MKGDSLSTLNVSPGQAITAKLHNDLLRRIAVMTGETPGGRRPVGGSSGPSGPSPFDVVLTVTGDPDEYDLTIIPGTINGSIPTSLFTPYLYDVADSATYVKISCTTDGKSLTGAAIVIDTTNPDIILPNSESGITSFEILLAVITPGAVINDIWQGDNMTVTLSQAFLEDKASPVPGMSPYTRWYTWAIASV